MREVGAYQTCHDELRPQFYYGACCCSNILEVASSSTVGGRLDTLTLFVNVYLKATLIHGELYFAVSEDERVVGIGMWHGPGTNLFDT